MNDNQPELTVHKLAHYVQVSLLGLDEQGRQQYVCPSLGCGETAYFDADGLGHCPTDEALLAFLTQSIACGGYLGEWQ
jgi:hypothetical protein